MLLETTLFLVGTAKETEFSISLQNGSLGTLEPCPYEHHPHSPDPHMTLSTVLSVRFENVGIYLKGHCEIKQGLLGALQGTSLMGALRCWLLV